MRVLCMYLHLQYERAGLSLLLLTAKYGFRLKILLILKRAQC